MFTRSRSGGNQNFGGRNNMANQPNQFSQGNNAYNQQGNYHGNNAFKPSGPNEPMKSGPGPQQQGNQQQSLGQHQHVHNPQQNSQPSQQNVQPSQPARLKPILKTTPPTPAPVNPPAAPATPAPAPAPAPATESEETTVFNQEDLSMEGSEGPRWKRNKVPGGKVNRKLKRLRMNQRLRKTLMPKNAIMVLNEMKAGVQFTVPETQSGPNSLFLVHANLDGKTYVGQGLSKLLARQNAAENALKSLLLEKMSAAALKTKVEDEPSDTSQAKGDGETDASAMDTTNGEEADDVPWSSLASFALHKLFLEWQNSGTVVPIPRSGAQQPIKQKSEPKTPTEKKLPANAETVHPVMLLNQMRPGTTYTEVSRVGNPPNILFTLAVELDGKPFTGTAKNKKDAKKSAAKAALEALYGLKYPEEAKESNHEEQQMETDQSAAATETK